MNLRVVSLLVRNTLKPNLLLSRPASASTACHSVIQTLKGLVVRWFSLSDLLHLWPFDSLSPSVALSNMLLGERSLICTQHPNLHQLPSRRTICLPLRRSAHGLTICFLLRFALDLPSLFNWLRFEPRYATSAPGDLWSLYGLIWSLIQPTLRIWSARCPNSLHTVLRDVGSGDGKVSVSVIPIHPWSLNPISALWFRLGCGSRLHCLWQALDVLWSLLAIRLPRSWFFGQDPSWIGHGSLPSDLAFGSLISYLAFDQLWFALVRILALGHLCNLCAFCLRLFNSSVLWLRFGIQLLSALKSAICQQILGKFFASLILDSAHGFWSFLALRCPCWHFGTSVASSSLHSILLALFMQV